MEKLCLSAAVSATWSAETIKSVTALSQSFFLNQFLNFSSQLLLFSLRLKPSCFFELSEVQVSDNNQIFWMMKNFISALMYYFGQEFHDEKKLRESYEFCRVSIWKIFLLKYQSKLILRMPLRTLFISYSYFIKNYVTLFTLYSVARVIIKQTNILMSVHCFPKVLFSVLIKYIILYPDTFGNRPIFRFFAVLQK